MIMISTSYVKQKIRQRPRDMHKGQAGRVLIIAGSRGMAGAAVLSLRGALYSGAGLVKALVPGELFNILQTAVPEAMCVDRDEICKGGTKNAAEFFAEFDAVAVGPGLGVKEENFTLIECLLERFEGSLVIDADALNCIAKYGSLAGRDAPTILTPHPGEADRLLKSAGCGTVRELGREAAAEALARKSGGVVLLKGADTVIADGYYDQGEHILYVNPTGNPGMATGGSGDVLTGITASFAAQKHLDMKPVEAACTGAFIHGLAGDIAAENIGEYGMTAADIADAISVAIREIERNG
ncbi:MAG: NAD(P)H-hydrate dehydratase [Bacillota bacterium]|nr:NAD(P)H-hydrate dehydratase [Bacillota bacterium]